MRRFVMCSTALLLAAMCGSCSDDQAQTPTTTTTQNETSGTVAERARQEAEAAVSSLAQQGQQTIDSLKQSGADNVESASMDERELAIRAGVSTAGTAKFVLEGYVLQGALDCTATSPEIKKFTVSCTGTVRSGQPVTLTGEKTGDGNATYVGKVGDTEVFKEECIGPC